MLGFHSLSAQALSALKRKKARRIAAGIIPGAGSGRRRKYQIETAQQYFDLIEKYKSLKDVPKKIERQIISAVTPFVKADAEIPVNGLLKTIPPSERVDFRALSENYKALNRLVTALEKMRIQEEEDLLLLMLLVS